jgi:antitoxin HigA-1
LPGGSSVCSTIWSNLRETGKGNTAYGSMKGYEFAFCGRTVTAMRLRLSTTIRRKTPSGKLPNVHPGEVLREEFLKPMGISAYKLAKGTNVSQTRISQIIHEQRGITVETALRFAKYFGNSAEFWLGLQNDFDLEEKRVSLRNALDSIQTMPQTVPENI